MWKAKKFPVITCLVGVLAAGASISAVAESTWEVTDNSFKCILHMKKVGDLYVDNLVGKLDGTVTVAMAGQGEYPEGSVLQIMPNEVMVKRHKGFSPATKDWEFFWIDLDKSGSNIYTRGAAEVNNRLGLNCFACHVKARPEFDFVCKTDQGCDPIPVTKAMFGALQRTDPRCPDADVVSAQDQESLAQLAEIVKALTAPAAEEQK